MVWFRKAKDSPGDGSVQRISAKANGNGNFIGQDNRLFDKFSLIIMLLGSVTFIVGASIDLATPKYPEIADIIELCAPPKIDACDLAVRAFDRGSHALSDFSWWRLLADTMQAIGLTMIAAVFISSTVDRRTRSFFFRQLAQKTEALGTNVLLGMFEARHHPRLFNLIKEHIFEKKVIRKNIDINYTLVDLGMNFAGTRLEGEDYLKVDVILSTVTENINLAQGARQGIVTVPVTLGLPNPLLDELKPYVAVNSFRFGDRQLSEPELEQINKKLQIQLKDDNQVSATIPIGECDLQPGEQVTVSGSYTMIKEVQDTEVFRTNEIAENIHLTVVNTSSHDLEIRARSTSHGVLHPQKSPSAQQWKLDDLSLPLQGIMVWWKKAHREEEKSSDPVSVAGPDVASPPAASAAVANGPLKRAPARPKARNAPSRGGTTRAQPR